MVFNMSEEKITVSIDQDLEDLIPGFLTNRGEDVKKLRSAFTDGNAEELRSIGHSLKGVGGGYGFARISEIGADIESAAKINDLKSIDELIDMMADYLDRLDIIYEEIP